MQKNIKKISNKLARKYKPEKIFLFGSWAWGKPTKDSDIDLLIIKKTREEFLKRQLRVRKIINGEFPVDLIVKTPEEMQKRIELGDFFYEDIVKKGKLIYEK